MHPGLETAAYSAMVHGYARACMLFSREEAIYGGYFNQIGEQFFFSALCDCGGKMAALSCSSVDSFELACICTKIICMSQLITSVFIVIYKLLNDYLATGINHVAGGVHHPGIDCHLTTSSAFLLPYTSHKEGNLPSTLS